MVQLPGLKTGMLNSRISGGSLKLHVRLIAPCEHHFGVKTPIQGDNRGHQIDGISVDSECRVGPAQVNPVDYHLTVFEYMEFKSVLGESGRGQAVCSLILEDAAIYHAKLRNDQRSQ